jgi:hypothetical protein
MANEIKFIFTGDTAEFDKAIDSVVKKTNKAKDATEGITDAQKTQAKLQKLLNEEYEQGAKTTGGLLKIQKEIKRVEEQRVKIEKRLAKSSLTRKNRLRDIVALSRTEARLAGLTAARRSAVKGAAISAGSAALTRVGLGAAAGAGGAAAGAAGAAGLALSGPVGWAIAALVAAVALIVISLKVFKAAIKGTAAAMNKAMGLQKTAQIAGKTVEQVQAEQVAGLFGGDAEKDFDLFKELGLIIDKELIASLARSGKIIMAFGMQVLNVLIPIFEKLALAAATLVKVFGASAVGLMATLKPVLDQIRAHPIISATPPGMAYALAQADFGAGGKAFEDYWNKMSELTGLTFEKSEQAAAQQAITRQASTDSLARIGIFKGQKDSELQTLKANLAAVQSIQGNTNGLIPAITNA